MLDSLSLLNRRTLIFDQGPLYHEFIADGTVREPWNAYSSLVFFIPVIFWILYLRGQYKDHKIIVALLPFLFLNGIGSTLYHAFRTSDFLLLLDWMPATIMSILLSSYFWTKIVKKWYFGFLCVLAFYVASSVVVGLVTTPENRDLAPNISYFFVGCSFLIPIVIHLYKNQFRFWYHVFAAFLFLGFSLLFRTLDYPTPNPFPALLPQGTHFLWHVFSSFAVFSMGFYIYNSNLRKQGKL